MLSVDYLVHRDGPNCHWCQRPVPILERTRDHLTPRSEGGGDNADNLVMACAVCNHTRGCIDEATWRAAIARAIREHPDDHPARWALAYATGKDVRPQVKPPKISARAAAVAADRAARLERKANRRGTPVHEPSRYAILVATCQWCRHTWPCPTARADAALSEPLRR